MLGDLQGTVSDKKLSLEPCGGEPPERRGTQKPLQGFEMYLDLAQGLAIE